VLAEASYFVSDFETHGNLGWGTVGEDFSVFARKIRMTI
jgi:hypothetical protein